MLNRFLYFFSRFCSSRDWGNYCEYIQRPGDIQVGTFYFDLNGTVGAISRDNSIYRVKTRIATSPFKSF